MHGGFCAEWILSRMLTFVTAVCVARNDGLLSAVAGRWLLASDPVTGWGTAGAHGAAHVCFVAVQEFGWGRV